MDKLKKFESFLDRMQGLLDNAKKQGHIIVRVEDLENAFPELTEEESNEKPNGGIVMENFDEGDGFYKVNLAYLNKEQVGEIEELVKKWNPELAESEDDRIRKALTDYFRWNSDGQLLNEFSNREVRAWLEKQGGITKLSEEEQNRFAKGVLTSCALSFIDYLDAHKYEGKMCVSNGECEDIENAFHNAMWDKLHRYYCKYIEKQGEKESDPRYKYLKELLRADDIYQMAMNDAMVQEAKTKAIDALSKLEIGNLLELEKQGEQRPRMIQWQGDNLKEVIDFTGKDKNFDKWFKSFEEYEKFVREHEGILKLFNEDGSHYEVPVGAWIVKTPDGYNVASKAVFKQKPAEWDDNDEYIFNTILHTLDLKKCKFEKEGNSEEAERWHTYYNWMKPLKNRILPQPKQEWSEEDKMMLQYAIEHFERQKRNCIEGGGRKKEMQGFIDFLKDLKDRVQPQHTWKPSKEQIIALRWVLNNVPYCKNKEEISGLLDQIKEL